MSEEVKDSGLTVPRAIFWTIIINGGLGCVALIAFLFSLPDVKAAINDPTGFPLVYVFRQCGGDGFAIAIVLIQLVILQFGNISYQAACARQTFAVSLKMLYAQVRQELMND